MWQQLMLRDWICLLKVRCKPASGRHYKGRGESNFACTNRTKYAEGYSETSWDDWNTVSLRDKKVRDTGKTEKETEWGSRKTEGAGVIERKRIETVWVRGKGKRVSETERVS